MARKLREHAEGHWYHVFNRGARRWPVFQTDADRLAFLALLKHLVEELGVEIHGFVLMGNHYHLVIRCPRNNLSAVMQELGQLYTQQFNHHHGVDGPLFRGRFGSRAITSNEQLITAIRYVARNPLDLPSVVSLHDYRWSSHRAHLGVDRSPSWLSTDVVWSLIGGPERYRSLVETDLPGDKTRARPTVEEIQRAVRAVTGAPHASLVESKRRTTNRPRLLAVLGASEIALANTAELAEAFGLASTGSARSTLYRARSLRESDPAFADLWTRLLQSFAITSAGV